MKYVVFLKVSRIFSTKLFFYRATLYASAIYMP